MAQFAGVRDAKEFLVAKIVEEARKEGVPLSDIERKMLYFSETGWTLPDIEHVRDAFHRQYDDQDYEHKIAGLIRNGRKHARASDPSAARSWSEALSVLEDGDHYLLVMSRPAASLNQGFDWRSLALLAAFAAAVVLLPTGLTRYLGHDANHDPNVVFVLWAIAVLLTVVYLMLRLFLGGPRVDRALGQVISILLGPGRR